MNASDETSVPDLEGPLGHRSLQAKTEKTDYLDILIRSLDTLIFFEIGILYCCDNISLILAIRAINQVLHVQPKDPRFGGISLAPTVAANLVCFGIHVFHAQPANTARAARGWLHGGLIVDFVGELGPVSKWRLLAYDIFIAALQILMLMIGHEKRVQSGEDKEGQTAAQDLEAEEAGIRKSGEGREDAATEEDGLEMDRLLPSGSKDLSIPSRKRQDEDIIATIDIKETLTGLARRRRPAAEATPTEPDERAARLRAIVGRMLSDRFTTSS